nr:hypothetical protein [Ktedonobacter sp. SOSP1-85]
MHYSGSAQAITDDILPLHHLRDRIGLLGISCDDTQAYVAHWHAVWYTGERRDLMAICQHRLRHSQTNAMGCANDCDFHIPVLYSLPIMAALSRHNRS